MKTGRGVLFVYLIFILFCVCAAAEEPARPKEPPEAQPEQSEVYTAGLIMGTLDSLDDNGRFLAVRVPREGSRRKTVYLDKQTQYYKENKPSAASELLVGQKIAVRFIADGSLVLADAVFLVEGEFEPEAYLKARKPKKRGKKPASSKH